MTKRKRSAVWMYFEENEENATKSLCIICSENIQHSNNTSNMLKHLRSKHPEEFSCVEEVRKMELPTLSKKKFAIKMRKKDSESENESKQAFEKKREVRVQYGDQEMRVLVPYLQSNVSQGGPQSADMNDTTQHLSEMGGENSLHAELELEVKTSPDNNSILDRSCANEVSAIGSKEVDAVASTDVGGTAFVARKRNEWMDLFHESLRSHLRTMDRHQQRHYISRVSQAVMEILDSVGSSS